MPSAAVRNVVSWFPVLNIVLLLHVIRFPALVTSQTQICPTDPTHCNTSVGSVVVCDGYGTLGNLPDACYYPSPSISLKIGSLATNVTSLPANILFGMDVWRLELAGLGIRAIDSAAFKYICQYLRELHLNDNRITSLVLDNNVFATCGRLNLLDLRNNLLVSVNYPTLYGVFGIVTLDLGGNRISKIAVDAFNGIGRNSLTSLLLNDNMLTVLVDLLFHHMGSMKQLYLQNNRIKDINSNSLQGLTTLELLNLTGNSIPLLPLGLFDPVGALRTLLLSHNAIARVDCQPFQSQSNLVVLDLSNNIIDTVSADWFQTTSRLQTVRLNRNRILSMNVTSLPTLLPALVDLDLSDNLLTTTSGMFTGWRSIVTLDLSRNPIGLRNGGVGEVTLLAGMTSLRKLGMSGLCMTTLDAGFRSLPNLTELSLADNLLYNVTEAASFSDLTSLVSLDLSSNNLVYVERDSFSALTRLRLLNLSNNALTGSLINGVGLSSGVAVDLSWNSVTSVNSVPQINGGVYLRGNPLSCSSDQCNAGTSWWPTNWTLLLDADHTACQSGGTPTLVVCQCSPSLSPSTDCSAPVSSADRYAGPSPFRTCPWDVNILNPNRPRFVGFLVRPTSTSSALVAWNVTDRQSAASGVRVLVARSTACANTSVAPFNVTELTDVERDVEVGANETEVVVVGLSPSLSYAVCGEIFVASGINMTTATDTACACVLLPVSVPVTTSTMVMTTVRTTTTTAVVTTSSPAVTSSAPVHTTAYYSTSPSSVSPSSALSSSLSTSATSMAASTFQSSSTSSPSSSLSSSASSVATSSSSSSTSSSIALTTSLLLSSSLSSSSSTLSSVAQTSSTTPQISSSSPVRSSIPPTSASVGPYDGQTATASAPAVISLTVEPGDTSLLVTWRVVVASGDATVIDYLRVTCNVSSLSTWTQLIDFNSSSSSVGNSGSSGGSYTVSQLSSSTLYNVCVEAVNRAAVNPVAIRCLLVTTTSNTGGPHQLTSTSLLAQDTTLSSSAYLLINQTSSSPSVLQSTSASNYTFLIVVIVVPICAFLLVLLLILLIVLCVRRRRRRIRDQLQSQKQQQGRSDPASGIVTSPKLAGAAMTSSNIERADSTGPERVPDNMAEQSQLSLSVYDVSTLA